MMKILLVEDTRTVAMVMSARLTSFGFDVVVAENGKIAVDKFTQEAPDLVLMDIEMPVMNGFEATNRIRAFEATQKWAWTPILFLTASDTAQNLVTAIEAGGDDFLAKAIPEQVLHAKMKAMSRIAQLRQRLSIANRRLEEQANQDGLTGLCNRRSMDMRVDIGWSDAESRGRSFGLLMLDVDNFKKYNDHYGHLAGDDCLRAVARAIDQSVLDAVAGGFAADAFSARYGGEEFAVVIPNATTAAVEGIALTIVDAIHKLGIAHENNATWGVVTISVGGAYIQRVSGPVNEVFRAADAALYRAKEAGRNRFELATPAAA
jgi:diguanylate cyclase (GGDEF)-like protein